MNTTPAGALAGIGNTPLVELVKIVPAESARVMVKLEFANPTGSMKDRMARAAIQSAAADGRLRPGDTVVEYTAGTTGVSLAFVCAALGYPLHVVFSDAFSIEKRLSDGHGAPTRTRGGSVRRLIVGGQRRRRAPCRRATRS